MQRLVTGPSMHAQGLQVVLPQGGEGEVAVGQNGHLRTVGGMNGIGRGAVVGDALYIGDILDSQEREFLGGDEPQFLDFVHHFGPFLLASGAGPGTIAPPLSFRQGRVAAHLSVPCSMTWRPALAGPLISTLRTRPSTTTRTRSMFKSPLSSDALATSIPSASTKERWNCRAAMPRWR